MRKKGFTLIELLVSIVLVSIVLVTMLSTLTKLKSTYNIINSNNDIEMYASTMSRIINNDINKNNGIEYVSCDIEGYSCDFYLANGSKRRIEINDVNVDTELFETNCCIEDNENCKCVTEKISNTLKYSDITDEDNSKIIYIKTLNTYKTTNKSTGAIDTEGYNFGKLKLTYVPFENVNLENYTSNLTSITIEINDTVDSNDHSNDVKIYSASNYSNDILRTGDEIKIKLCDSNEDCGDSHTTDLILKYNIGFFKYNSNGKLIEIKNNKIDVPTKEGYQFGGYYYKDVENNTKVKVIDENGNIKIGNSFFSKNELNIFFYVKWTEESFQTVYDYDYTGNEEIFTAPENGYYKLETWGAQGGSVTNSNVLYEGGYGAYSSGYVHLNKNDKLYINVGGAGIGATEKVVATIRGGYNGGGDGTGATDKFTSSGGGATHIASSTGLLVDFENNQDDLLIVSGGGGGSAFQNSTSYGYGGAAGGYLGADGTYEGTKYKVGTGGSQTAVGVGTYNLGGFGLGSSSTQNGLGGGGGYYGGGDGKYYNGAGGGSGYIGNPLLINKKMYCYNCTESNDINTKTISTTCNSDKAKSECSKKENGYATITYVGDAIIESNFDYTGNEEIFTAPKSGYYKLETWGAQGGSYSTTYLGGYGGYSFGYVYLNRNENLYINVGGQGTYCSAKTAGCAYGGYNGGGTTGSSADANASGGGGATHIAKTSGLLSTLSDNIDDILIVSGGGGGGDYGSTSQYGNGGHGGGFIGTDGTTKTANRNGLGGTQTNGGTGAGQIGLFGEGGSNTVNSGGGGGGYFGGAAGDGYRAGGGGGSSYIGNSLLINKKMYCYNCTESNDINTKTISTTCTSNVAKSGCSKQGNGYAAINYIGETITEWDYAYAGVEEEFTAPKSGYYKLETWGAQGGSYSTTYLGGYGGYSFGYVYLDRDDNLYINVGGQGTYCSAKTAGCAYGGYNGGGTTGSSAAANASGGGGATHIAKTSGLLSTLSDNIDDILIVSGGGGGGDYGSTSQYGNGGHGGGFIGTDGTTKTANRNGLGGTQTNGGTGAGQIGLFGEGGSNTANSGGGGGGYYGGAAGDGYCAGGGGGSSYIGNSLLINKKMYCYNCTESDDINTKTTSTTCYSDNATSECSKQGNGYAKITYVGEVPNEREFSYTGNVQTFIPSESGYYKLEVWGAQGGSYDVAIGGYGGYSTGKIYLNKNDELYVTVGGAGSYVHSTTAGETIDGGYNGGGEVTCKYSNEDFFCGAGGGASHISLSSGLLKTFNNDRNKILIVAGGGGGGAFYSADNHGLGGSGGGISGSNGTSLEGTYYGLGGSQINAGVTNGLTESIGSFGLGGSLVPNATGENIIGSSGGGGYYGGGSGTYSYANGAGGGSGYIGNSKLFDKSMYCYNCKQSNEKNLKTISTNCSNGEALAECSKKGNGYAKITFISDEIDVGDIQ